MPKFAFSPKKDQEENISDFFDYIRSIDPELAIILENSTSSAITKVMTQQLKTDLRERVKTEVLKVTADAKGAKLP